MCCYVTLLYCAQTVKRIFRILSLGHTHTGKLGVESWRMYSVLTEDDVDCLVISHEPQFYGMWVIQVYNVQGQLSMVM